MIPCRTDVCGYSWPVWIHEVRKVTRIRRAFWISTSTLRRTWQPNTAISPVCRSVDESRAKRALARWRGRQKWMSCPNNGHPLSSVWEGYERIKTTSRSRQNFFARTSCLANVGLNANVVSETFYADEEKPFWEKEQFVGQPTVAVWEDSQFHAQHLLRLFFPFFPHYGPSSVSFTNEFPSIRCVWVSKGGPARPSANRLSQTKLKNLQRKFDS